MPSGTLICTGTVRTRGGRQVVVLDGENCQGCDGNCRLRIAAPQLALPATSELQDGTTVEIAATSRRFAAQATWIFGVPLFAALLAAAIVERTSVSVWLIPAAMLVASATLTVAHLVLPAKTAGGTAIEAGRTPPRIRII